MTYNTAPLTVRHRHPFPDERVFDAWLHPPVASRWLFRTPDGENVRCDIDARPGGTFVITDRRAGEDVEHCGTYLELVRPRRLVFTFSVPKYSSEETTVMVDLAPAGTGCEVTLVHHGVPADWAEQTEQGWRDLLARLDDLLQG
jgi:uncharacterized protein YndB with AHSA1/START domain